MAEGSVLLKMLSTALPETAIKSGEGDTLEADDEDVEVVLLGSSSESDHIYADKISGDSDEPFGFYLPKYFQALITLITCGLLLFCTLAIIQQTRRLCQKNSCTSRKIPLSPVGSDRSRKDAYSTCNELNSVDVKPDNENYNKNGDAAGIRTGDRHFDYYNPSPSPNQTTTTKNLPAVSNQNQNQPAVPNQEDAEALKAQELLKLKRVRFVRRVSGTFSDDAIDFVQQTYKAKYKEGAPHPQKPGEVNTTKQSIRRQPPHFHPQAPPPAPPK